MTKPERLFLKLDGDRSDPLLVRVVVLHDDFLELKQVFECWALATDDPVLVLESAFEEFNIGETSMVARIYRARRLRSLSTGDVVVIGDVAYRCDAVGWAKFPLYQGTKT